MSQAAEAGQWWTVPPARQVSHLVDADPELLKVALDPLPETAPAFVAFRPAVGRSLGDQVTAVIDELERAAVALFPHWLPGAERVDGPQGLGVAAVRILAAQAAAQSPSFGPFLADLAERSLRERTSTYRTRSRFPAEVRAAGLARVVASAYGREATIVLIELPDGMTPADERALVAVAEWLVSHGRFTVWLAGRPLEVVDRVRSVTVPLPAHLTRLLTETHGAEQAGDVTGTPSLAWPPLSGVPRGDSPAELALERALAAQQWAHGRRWNHTFEPDILGKQYRLDLLWPAEGVVVEVDGPEHRGVVKFADDRRRDVQLQLLGYAVLRFPNEEVLADVHLVVHHIRRLLVNRRGTEPSPIEMRHRVTS